MSLNSRKKGLKFVLFYLKDKFDNIILLTDIYTYHGNWNIAKLTNRLKQPYMSI